MPHMIYVVGSGPSGIAAAAALLDRGVPVTMLDVGVECEPERMATVRRMSAQKPEAWSAADQDEVRSPIDADRKLPLKLAYGSAFVYATDELRVMAQRGTSCLMSYAKGGLSNVWGAAVLPNMARDMADWPVSSDELAPHYASVARLMPIAAERDELESLFPFHAPPAPALRPSRLAAWLLAGMRSQRERLSAAGIFFGQSRLAVRTEADPSGAACQYTGRCLSGCPFFAIWNAATALEALRARPGFTYRPGVLVERVVALPDGTGVTIQALATDGTGRQSLVGRRVLLACGPISTLRIVIDSLEAYDRTLALQFQPYFLIPMVAMRNSGNVESERLHTLAQIFLELIDPRISAHPVHLQAYTFNEFIGERTRHATRWLGPLGAFARARLQGRLLALQGYLHSSETAPITVTSRFDAARGRATLTLAAPSTSEVPRIMGQVIATLRRHALNTGALPLAPMTVVGQPGDGNHVGGAFPMRRDPGDFEADVLGQLPRLPGVHIVDSSTLPSLAATTFTYTTMAHAHRIADAVAQLVSQG